MRTLALPFAGLLCASGAWAQEPSSEKNESPADAELIKEIEAATAPPAEAASRSNDEGGLGAKISSALGLSNAFNPAMSVNGLFIGRAARERRVGPDGVAAGVGVQELELQLLANVDPYFGANFILALPEGLGIEVEEGYVTPTWQPLGLQARVGKMKLAFGRENTLHAHALPFIDKSLVGEAVFGDEGLNETGLELSYLFPLPWYALLYAGGFGDTNEGVFGARSALDLSAFTALRNVFDLTDDATLEAGASYTLGRNAANDTSQVIGGHLVFKWHPAREAREREAVVVVEGLYATHPNSFTLGPDHSLSGAYAYAQWRLAQRWYTAARFDYLGWPNDDRGIARRGSAILVFAPSEFSAVRLQGSATDDGGPLAYEAFLQLNVTLGAHPAHAY